MVSTLFSVMERSLWASSIFHLSLYLCQDFEEGYSGLLRCGALNIYDHTLRVNEQEQDTIIFLNAVLEPFIETYQVFKDDDVTVPPIDHWFIC